MYTPLPVGPSQGTLLLFDGLQNFTWEDPSQAYPNSFVQSWPQYISTDSVRKIESSDPVDAMLANVYQKKIKSLMLERNALLESGQASRKRID